MINIGYCASGNPLLNIRFYDVV